MVENLEQYFTVNPKAFYYSPKLKKNIGKSVHFTNKERFDLAKEQKAKPTVSISNIIKYVNDILDSIGIKTFDEEQVKMNPNDIKYDEIKRNYHLKNEQDIIWLKFTDSGYVGAVACSNDIGFDIPKNKSEYNDTVIEYNKYKKCNEKVWKYTTAGILVHSVGMTWDKSFVLVFPLESKKEPCIYGRHEIETAIGNYLEAKEVPIIDYYSHNY